MSILFSVHHACLYNRTVFCRNVEELLTNSNTLRVEVSSLVYCFFNQISTVRPYCNVFTRVGIMRSLTVLGCLPTTDIVKCQGDFSTEDQQADIAVLFFSTATLIVMDSP